MTDQLHLLISHWVLLLPGPGVFLVEVLHLMRVKIHQP